MFISTLFVKYELSKINFIFKNKVANYFAHRMLEMYHSPLSCALFHIDPKSVSAPTHSLNLNQLEYLIIPISN